VATPGSQHSHIALALSTISFMLYTFIYYNIIYIIPAPGTGVRRHPLLCVRVGLAILIVLFLELLKGLLDLLGLILAGIEPGEQYASSREISL